MLDALDQAITKHFGEVDRWLEVVIDPEATTIEKMLYAVVDAKDDEWLKTLERFDDEWPSIQRLCVTIGAR